MGDIIASGGGGSCSGGDSAIANGSDTGGSCSGGDSAIV